MAQYLGKVPFSHEAVPCRLSGLSEAHFPDAAAFDAGDLRMGPGLGRAGIALVAALQALARHPDCRENAGSQKAHSKGTALASPRMVLRPTRSKVRPHLYHLS